MDKLVTEVAEAAYDKAVESVSDTVREATVNEGVSIIEDYAREITKPEHGCPPERTTFAKKLLHGLVELMKRKTTELADVVKKVLSDPETRKKNQDEIAESAKASFREKLAWAKAAADLENAQRKTASRVREGGER